MMILIIYMYILLEGRYNILSSTSCCEGYIIDRRAAATEISKGPTAMFFLFFLLNYLFKFSFKTVITWLQSFKDALIRGDSFHSHALGCWIVVFCSYSSAFVSTMAVVVPYFLILFIIYFFDIQYWHFVRAQIL